MKEINELKKLADMQSEFRSAIWWGIPIMFLFFFGFTAMCLKINHVWEENIINSVRLVVLSSITIFIYSTRFFSLSDLKQLPFFLTNTLSPSLIIIRHC